MASTPRIEETVRLEDFLTQSTIDEHPYQELIDGRVELKVSPQAKHSVLTKRLVAALDSFAAAGAIGEAFPELRCTFAGASIVPDVVFLLREHIAFDSSGVIENEVRRAPDIHVEIVSPEQSVGVMRRKLEHSTSHGGSLGILIDPERQLIDVYRDGQARRLLTHEAIEGEPVLPGFRLPVAEVFRWLRRDP